ncbi:hypothetical protein [Mycobacteroides abscessus]|uniref:hypothetical protein n=1 Tax=Mycobacteroides abscessus TaxID=36809 RepID=UPI0012FFDDBB|nr:hypothetical protein [Mycobacteroides abscessus]
MTCGFRFPAREGSSPTVGGRGVIATYILEKVPAVGDSILRPKVRSSKRHGPYIEVALELLTARGQVDVRGQEIHRVALLAA